MEAISEKIYEQAINLPIDERLILIDTKILDIRSLFDTIKRLEVTK